ncbi:MAG: ABC transporter substrate-binding protein [Chloroflexota bacterium]
MKVKFVVGLVVLIVVLSACAGAETPLEFEAGDLTKIRLPMGYIPTVQYASLYLAKEKGYFADAGFDVEFDYSFETDGVALVGQGEQPFSLASGEQVLLAREQGIPVVYVMAWYQDYPVAVVAKTESGINNPADLVGKRVGLPGLYGANYIGLIAMLHAEGIAETDLVLDSIGFNQVEALATDQVEAVVGYSTNEPVHLRNQGYQIVNFQVSEFVQLTANGLITNETMIAENPEAVRRFVSAMVKAVEETIADPESAYLICHNYVEGLAEQDKAVQMEVLNLSIEYWKAEKIGYSQQDAWENMEAVLLEMGLLSNPLDLDAAFTNQFID